MALKALDIFKLLPKTNCKKCGSPTCLAFAMKLAQKQATLDECPDVTDEAKAALDGAASPPIRLVTLGAGTRNWKSATRRCFSGTMSRSTIPRVSAC